MKKIGFAIIIITLVFVSSLLSACSDKSSQTEVDQVPETASEISSDALISSAAHQMPETDAPVMTSSVEDTTAAAQPLPSETSETVAPSGPDPENQAVSTIPESLSAQAQTVEARGTKYVSPVKYGYSIYSSYLPFEIEEEETEIRQKMETYFYTNTVWSKTALEYVLRLNDSIYACTQKVDKWFKEEGQLQTAWGGSAPVLTAAGSFPPYKTNHLSEIMDEFFIAGIRIGKATADYNGHSYAWSGGKTDQGWLEDPLPLMLDPSVSLVQDPQPGDVIVYLAPGENGGDIPVHSALVREILGDTVFVESKLGQLGVYLHALDTVPNEYYYTETEETDKQPVGIIRYLVFRVPGGNKPVQEPVRPEGLSEFFEDSSGDALLPAALADKIRKINYRLGHGTDEEMDGDPICGLLTDSQTEKPLTTDEQEQLEIWIRQYYPFGFQLEESSSAYNGHSYAWSGGKTDQGWLESPAALWLREDVQVADTPQAGDVIVYVKQDENGDWQAVHSALVREVIEETVLVESKFGNGGLYLHEMTDVPGAWTVRETITTPEGHYSNPRRISYLIFRLPPS